ncbi:MAG TPA: nuclear transport factor 2 family protein, partial [Dongiaceae bacterium]
MNQQLSKSSIPATAATPVEQIYFAWDDALSRNDKEALLALYAPDAVIESPLIPHVLKTERGIVR